MYLPEDLIVLKKQQSDNLVRSLIQILCIVSFGGYGQRLLVAQNKTALPFSEHSIKCDVLEK